MPYFQFGKPVSGDNFVNRAEELGRLEELILPSYKEEQDYLKKRDWESLGRSVFDLLQQQTDKLRFLIILDEIGLFVRNLDIDDSEKRRFLHFLRGELNKPKTPPFIICGSQNFLTIVSETVYGRICAIGDTF